MFFQNFALALFYKFKHIFKIRILNINVLQNSTIRFTIENLRVFKEGILLAKILVVFEPFDELNMFHVHE